MPTPPTGSPTRRHPTPWRGHGNGRRGPAAYGPAQKKGNTSLTDLPPPTPFLDPGVPAHTAESSSGDSETGRGGEEVENEEEERENKARTNWLGYNTAHMTAPGSPEPIFPCPVSAQRVRHIKLHGSTQRDLPWPSTMRAPGGTAGKQGGKPSYIPT